MEELKQKAITKVVKKPKKRKKLTQQQIIRIGAIGLAAVFLLGLLAVPVVYIVNGLNPANGSNVVQYNTDAELLALQVEYEAAYKKDPKDKNNILELLDVYSQLGYTYREKGDEATAVAYFLKAVEYSRVMLELNPDLSTSSQYMIAGYLAEAGSLDEAEAIYKALIASNVDPVVSRISYGDFLLNKRKDAVGSKIQIDAALAATTSDAEREYYNNIITQYKLNQ